MSRGFIIENWIPRIRLPRLSARSRFPNPGENILQNPKQAFKKCGPNSSKPRCKIISKQHILRHMQGIRWSSPAMSYPQLVHGRGCITFSVPSHRVLRKIEHHSDDETNLRKQALGKSLGLRMEELAALLEKYDCDLSPIKDQSEVRVRLYLPKQPPTPPPARPLPPTPKPPTYHGPSQSSSEPIPAARPRYVVHEPGVDGNVTVLPPDVAKKETQDRNSNASRERVGSSRKKYERKTWKLRCGRFRLPTIVEE
ncbi:hypothetical protein DM02DRAFT_340240 [Periconia macrospinosa]|uniref:Uncharacterized protein n=1 Tax=Periconia macrospinosa TaxID=97972 RepID=A0A2V1D2K2_9PLEO|nr:hypothetical protein DM02DRAFT_340240 [Periconia macrospinosa]